MRFCRALRGGGIEWRATRDGRGTSWLATGFVFYGGKELSQE